MEQLGKLERTARTLCCVTCLCLSGCIFGYYAPAPDGYRGEFVLGAVGATLDRCDIGPGLWSGSTPATCIYAGQHACATCTIVPAGTPVTVLHQFVYEIHDVALRVGRGAGAKVVHTLYWDQVKGILERSGPPSKPG